MTNQQAIERTRQFIQDKFNDETSGHDYWHMIRVWRLAQHIMQHEPSADPFVVELASLLHDIADWKFTDGDEEAGPHEARKWLESIDVAQTTILQIEDIVRNVSFKGKNIETKLSAIEGKIVHDADKLDAIGAIGIGRAFAYGGMKGRAMHDPARKPAEFADAESYRTNVGTTINHFYEKLLLLQDRMFTETGKAMAKSRHAYTERFLQEFYDEWDGKL